MEGDADFNPTSMDWVAGKLGLPVEGKIETWRDNHGGGILSSREFMELDNQLMEGRFWPGGRPAFNRELRDDWLDTTHLVFVVIERPGEEMEMRSVQFGTSEVCSFPVKRE